MAEATMRTDDFIDLVRADLRLALDPSNAPVQRGSPLWERLTDHTPDSDIDIPVRRKEGVALW